MVHKIPYLCLYFETFRLLLLILLLLTLLLILRRYLIRALSLFITNRHIVRLLSTSSCDAVTDVELQMFFHNSLDILCNDVFNALQC